MKKYRCKFCNYSTLKEEKPRSCNYCGKQNAMIEERDANEILDLA